MKIILIQVSLKFVCEGLTDDMLPLIWIIAWSGIDGKPLPETIATQVHDTIRCL